MPHKKWRNKTFHCRLPSTYQSRLTTLINLFLLGASCAACSYEHFAPLFLPLATLEIATCWSSFLCRNEKAKNRAACTSLAGAQAWRLQGAGGPVLLLVWLRLFFFFGKLIWWFFWLVGWFCLFVCFFVLLFVGKVMFCWIFECWTSVN